MVAIDVASNLEYRCVVTPLVAIKDRRLDFERTQEALDSWQFFSSFFTKMTLLSLQ